MGYKHFINYIKCHKSGITPRIIFKKKSFENVVVIVYICDRKNIPTHEIWPHQRKKKPT